MCNMSKEFSSVLYTSAAWDILIVIATETVGIFSPEIKLSISSSHL